MSATKKITKRDNYTTLLDIIDLADDNNFEIGDGSITFDALRDFINNEITLLDNKAAAAKKRAAEKRAEGDDLRENVYNSLSTTDYMTIDEIVELLKLDNPDVSRNMVTSRLTQLINLGRAEKDTTTVKPTTEGGKSRKVTTYRAIAE